MSPRGGSPCARPFPLCCSRSRRRGAGGRRRGVVQRRQPEAGRGQGRPAVKMNQAIEAFKVAHRKRNKEATGRRRRRSTSGGLLRARRGEDMNDRSPSYYMGSSTSSGETTRRPSRTQGRRPPEAHVFEAWTELGDAHTHLAATRRPRRPTRRPSSSTRRTSSPPRPRHERTETVVTRKRAPTQKGSQGQRRTHSSTGSRRSSALHRRPAWETRSSSERRALHQRTDVDQSFADWLGVRVELIQALRQVFEKAKIELRSASSPSSSSRARRSTTRTAARARGGHYDPQCGSCSLQVPGQLDDADVLYHEGFHQFLHPYLPRAPSG